MFDSAAPWTARLLCPWGFSRQEYWSELPCPPPRDLPNRGIKPSFPHCRQIHYHLTHQGSPRILEWVAYSFSRVSSRPRNWTIRLGSPALQVDSLPAELPGNPSTPDQKFKTRLLSGKECKLQDNLIQEHRYKSPKKKKKIRKLNPAMYKKK